MERTTFQFAIAVDNKQKLEKILKALDKISKEKVIFFPIHPRTKKRITDTYR